jgi:CubicO group peptidase (beta-lactamase class C family)
MEENMKKILSVLLIISGILISSNTANASEVTVNLPSGLSVSELEARIDTYVKEHEATTAAMSVAVYSGHDTLLEKSYGYMDLENKLPNTGESVLEWGSCTKLLTWVSVMQLVEQGKLDLSTDIRNYLPEGFFKKLNYEEPITLLNLMNHDAGWQEIMTDLFMDDMKNVKDLGATLKFLEPEQVAAPGERMAYSNWGTALAGYIVELVSGESFDAYVKKHIFTPLGMEHTAISPDLSDNLWVATQRNKEKCYTNMGQSLGTALNHIALYPTGMVTGTIGDFVKFAQSLQLSDSTSTPLFEHAETLKEMQSPSAYYADGITPRNCHGFWTDNYSVPVLWHNGGTIGSTSWFAFDPVSGIGVVILTNQSSEYIYTCGILPMVFGNYQYTAVTDTTDISGLYVSSRTVFSGYGKLYRLFCMTQISPDEHGFVSTGKTYTGIADNTFVVDMSGIKQFSLFATVNTEGKKVLQIPSEDYLEVNVAHILAELVLLLLYVIAFFYCIIALLVRLVRIARHRKKPVHPVALSINNISVIVSVLLTVYMSIQLFSSTALYQSIQWILILNGICALIPVVYAGYLLLNLRKLNCPGRTKAALIANTCMCLIMTANIVYWNTYKFW